MLSALSSASDGLRSFMKSATLRNVTVTAMTRLCNCTLDGTASVHVLDLASTVGFLPGCEALKMCSLLARLCQSASTLVFTAAISAC